MALPEAGELTVEIELKSMQPRRIYKKNLLSDVSYDKWSPELKQHMDKAIKEVEADLTELLKEMTVDYFGDNIT